IELRFPIPSTSRSSKREGENQDQLDISASFYSYLNEFRHVLEAVVKSPSFPNHKVRVVKSKMQTGYKPAFSSLADQDSPRGNREAFRSIVILYSFSNAVVAQ